MIFVLIIVIFVLCLLYVGSFNWRHDGSPPGVKGFQLFPFLGKLFTKPIKDISQLLLDRFGDIACVQLLNFRNLVFIGNHDLLKEAFSKAELSDRPAAHISTGLVSSNGRVWREQRRFALSTLRDFGMGKIAQEEMILHECVDLVKEFENHEEFDPKFCLTCAVTNVICGIIFSDRFEYGDPVLRKVTEAVTSNITRSRNVIMAFFSQSKYMPGMREELKKIMKNAKFVEELIRKYIQQHRETYIDGNIRDYIDAYLCAMKSSEKDPDTTFTEPQLIRSVQDLFVAGSETTSNTLRWGLALMALNADVQRKVHEEIDNVIGSDRQPNMSDKLKMPYTEAVLLEIQRFASIVPLVGHKANTSTTIGGYRIEKGTIVTADCMRMNRDKRVWEKPDQFYVGHFYKENDTGGEVINRNYFTAFSVGKRSCIGESLAKMETFLFFVALMQKFNFSCRQGEEPDFDKPLWGIVRSLSEVKICRLNRF